MKIFENISIIDSVDSCCSTKGNEFIYEKDGKTNILVPCFNVGFYENEINESAITQAVDICYFLFECVTKLKIHLSTYKSLLPNNYGIIDFDGKEVNYEFNFCFNEEVINEYEIGGLCLRSNSFSYGNYNIYAKSMTIILLEETKFINEYTSNDEYKKDKGLQSFLLNQENMKYINKIIKTV